MTKQTVPLSVRLSPQEMSSVVQAASNLGISKSELIKRATLALAAKAGAALHTTQEERMYVRCSADERAALVKYAARNEIQNLSTALRAAARATLVQRGDLVLPEHTYPDADTSKAAMLPAQRPVPRTVEFDTIDWDNP